MKYLGTIFVVGQYITLMSSLLTRSLACSLIRYVYVLTYICMYIHYCTMHAAPHPLEYTDIATYTGLEVEHGD